VARLLQRNRDVYIGTHVRPDGDALGTLLGLALALEKQGSRVARLCVDPVPDNYRFLPGARGVSAHPPDWPAQVGIAVDCDGASRLGDLEPVLTAIPHVVDIDHHATDQAFGEERLIDSHAGATAEIVYELLAVMGVKPDPKVATCLLTAIVTDTGRFCYGNTTSRSLRIAGDLIEAGADPHRISRKVYEERSVAAMHLLGRALSRLSQDIDSQVVSSMLTSRDSEETGASPGDTEGIIDHLRAIGGPSVALLVVEREDGQARVSLRSDGTVDVSEIALGFGGGGHMMAAGCTVAATGEQAKAAVLKAIRAALARAERGDAA
jgi:phosphoesterase RecJ-like protein